MEDEKLNGATELPEEQAEEAATPPVAACMDEEKKQWKERLEVLERQVEQLQAQVEMEDAKSAQKLAAKKPAHGQPGTTKDIKYKVMCWLFGGITADMIAETDKIFRRKIDITEKVVLAQYKIDAYYEENLEKLDSAALMRRKRMIKFNQQLLQNVVAMLIAGIIGYWISEIGVSLVRMLLVVVLMVIGIIAYIALASKPLTYYDEMGVGDYETAQIDKILKERQEAKRRELEAQSQGPTLIPKDND